MALRQTQIGYRGARRWLHFAFLLLTLVAGIAALSLLLMAFGLAVPAPALAEVPPLELIERGRFKEARALLEPRVKAKPDDVEALVLLSQVKAGYRDLDGALALAEKAVRLDAKNARAHEVFSMALGEAAGKAGPIKQMSLGRRFKKEADAAVALDPTRIDAQFALMLFYLKAPGILGGDKKKARAKADEIARLDPVQGEFARARLAMEGSDTTTAIAHYRKAVELGPNDYEARITYANQLAGRREFAAAESQALEAKRIDPGRAGAYTVLAIVYANQERSSDLEATLAAAEAAVPGNLSSYYQAARVLLLSNKELERAEGYLRKYLTVEPEGGTPQHAHARWRLGLVLEKQGRHAEALAEVEAAIKMKPDLEEAKKDLKRLKKQV